MSNPFLNYGSSGGDLAALQDGTVDINVATIKDQSLIPNLPLASDASKKIIARLLGVADLVPGTIPAVPTTTLTSAGGTETLVNDGTGPALAVKGISAGAGGITLSSTATAVSVSYNDTRLLAVEADTQNIIVASAGQTTFAGIVSAATYQLNEAPIIASGTALTVSSTSVPSCIGFRFTIAAPQLITYVGVPTVHWPVANAAITRRCNIWTEVGVLVAGYDLPKTTILGAYYVLAVSLLLPAGTYRYAIDRGIEVSDSSFNANIAFTTDPRVSAVAPVAGAAYNIFPNLVLSATPLFHSGVIYLADQFSGVIETPILKGPGVDPVALGSDLDFSNVYSLLRCLKINGIQPNGGVYSETATSSTAFAGITPATNILGRGLFAGSTSVPAGAFVAGDCYGLKIGGTITCSNNDTFTLIVRSNFGLASPAIFQTYVVIVDGAQVNGWWELEVEFTIRAIGGPGVAAIMSNGNITYTNASSVYKGLGVNTLTSTLFVTTVQNTLAVTYQTAAAAITSFAPSLIVLTKLY